jgi:hypothetical protein
MPLSDKTKNQILDMIKKDMQPEIDAMHAKKTALEKARASAAGGFYVKFPYLKTPYVKLPYIQL